MSPWSLSRRAIALVGALALMGSTGCVGASESEAWADDEAPESRPVDWEGKEGKSRERRVSSRSRALRPSDPGFARPGDRRVSIAEGDGWQVTTRGGTPVETFASAEGPVGFEPRDPRQAPAKRVVGNDRPGPWLVVPSRAPETFAGGDENPQRTPLRLKAEGVELVPGECGLVPVARYGLDWRPAREWRVGQDENPEPWLQPVPPLPLPPAPKPGEVQEAEVPAGSWIEAR